MFNTWKRLPSLTLRCGRQDLLQSEGEVDLEYGATLSLNKWVASPVEISPITRGGLGGTGCSVGLSV